jgi:hypothetical protein
MDLEAYNPLDIPNLGKSLTEAFLARPLQPLPTHTFKGAGIYGLYYLAPEGEGHELYRREMRGSVPIYVGKAMSAGSPNTLYQRLGDHRKSIEAAPTLRIEDFQCRFLLVDDVWIPLGEQLLIDKFNPLWNKKIKGFGNKTLGDKRESQKPAPWDLIHPGRQRSTNPTTEAEREKLLAALKKYLDSLSDED